MQHTVFGKVVGGFETLSAFEKVQVDDNDRPKEDIVIQKVTIFVNPYAGDSYLRMKNFQLGIGD